MEAVEFLKFCIANMFKWWAHVKPGPRDQFLTVSKKRIKFRESPTRRQHTHRQTTPCVRSSRLPTHYRLYNFNFLKSVFPPIYLLNVFPGNRPFIFRSIDLRVRRRSTTRMCPRVTTGEKFLPGILPSLRRTKSLLSDCPSRRSLNDWQY